MIKRTLMTLAIGAALTAPALADPITGNWRTQSGETARISACGGSFCIKLTSGTYSGKQIGKVKLQGNKYVGTITDPADDKTYSGSARLTGSSMKMQGCVAKIFCRSQTWNKL